MKERSFRRSSAQKNFFSKIKIIEDTNTLPVLINQFNLKIDKINSLISHPDGNQTRRKLTDNPINVDAIKLKKKVKVDQNCFLNFQIFDTCVFNFVDNF